MIGDLSHKAVFFRELAKDPDLSASAKTAAAVLLFVFHNSDTGQCNPGLQKIGDAAGMKRRETIVDAVRRLEKAGWISIERSTGRTRTNNFTFPWSRVPEPERVRKTGGQKESGFSEKRVRSSGAKSLKNKDAAPETIKNTFSLREKGFSYSPSRSASAANAAPRRGGEKKTGTSYGDLARSMYRKQES